MSYIEDDYNILFPEVFGSSPLSSPIACPVQDLHSDDLPEDADSIEEVSDGEPGTAVVAIFQDILKQLKEHELTWGDFIEYLSDPRYKQGTARYDGFFKNPGQVKRVLNHWSGWRNSPTGRRTVHEWIVEWVCRRMNKEGRAATNKGFLQSYRMVVNTSFITRFSVTNLYEKLETLSPIFLQIVHAFSTTARQLRLSTEQSLRRKKTVSFHCNFLTRRRHHSRMVI